MAHYENETKAHDANDDGFADIPRVEVDCYDGLLADYARRRQADVIVKGLRAMSDFEYEFQMALTNRKLNPEAETVFLTTTAEHMYLSSSLVKQVAELGGDIDASCGQLRRKAMQES